MRGILFGLVFSNLVYLGWGFMAERLDTGLVDAQITRSNDASVVLVSESPPEDLQYYLMQSPEPSLSGPPEAIEDGVPPGQYCAEIGPFENLSDAEGFAGTNASRFAMTVDVRRLPAPPGYRVYLPPVASRELADSTMTALREAFAANDLAIDSFLISRGELENGIALGLFSEQRNATNVQTQLERLGYKVVIAEEERFLEEFWVLVSGVESEAEFTRHWAEIQLSRSYIRAGEKLCETIAHGV